MLGRYSVHELISPTTKVTKSVENHERPKIKRFRIFSDFSEGTTVQKKLLTVIFRCTEICSDGKSFDMLKYVD